MPQSAEPFRDPSAPLFEQRMNELEKGEGAGAITGAKIAKETIKAENTETAFYPRTVLWEGGVVIKEALAKSESPQLYVVSGSGGGPATAAATLAGVAKCGEVLPSLINFETPGQEITGKSTKLELFVSLLTGKAASPTFVFGLYEITAIGETTKQCEFTVNTTALSTCTFTTPAAKSAEQKTGAAVAGVKGKNMVIGFTTSAATAAESLVVATCKVFISHV